MRLLPFAALVLEAFSGSCASASCDKFFVAPETDNVGVVVFGDDRAIVEGIAKWCHFQIRVVDLSWDSFCMGPEWSKAQLPPEQ